MILRVPKDRECVSSLALEEARKPVKKVKKGTFHTRMKPDYSSLINFMAEDRIKR